MVCSVDLESSAGLSSLCVSLLETLSDRQIQIKHQRATNRELVDRLNRLQEKLVSIEGGEILVYPSQVIMNNYKPSTDSDEVLIPSDELQRRLSRVSQDKSAEKEEVRNDITDEDGKDDEVYERPDTPEYDDLQKRFENLLNILGSRHNSVDVEAEDNVFQDLPASSTGVVHYTCARPPDILDFTRPSLPDIELEEVAITLDGMQIVTEQVEEQDEELPDHIQELVNKAMKDIP